MAKDESNTEGTEGPEDTEEAGESEDTESPLDKLRSIIREEVTTATNPLKEEMSKWSKTTNRSQKMHSSQASSPTSQGPRTAAQKLEDFLNSLGGQKRG